MITLSMTSPRALDFTNDGTNNPVHATNAWAEALWDEDQLLFNGSNSTQMGIAWTTATNIAGLGDFNRFVFDGITLSVVREPPPKRNGYPVVLIEE